MILPKLIQESHIIFLVGMFLLFLSLVAGCNRVVFVHDGQSVRLLEDVKHVKVSAKVNGGEEITTYADLKAGGFVIYLPAKEIINGSD